MIHHFILSSFMRLWTVVSQSTLALQYLDKKKLTNLFPFCRQLMKVLQRELSGEQYQNACKAYANFKNAPTAYEIRRRKIWQVDRLNKIDQHLGTGTYLSSGRYIDRKRTCVITNLNCVATSWSNGMTKPMACFLSLF